MHVDTDKVGVKAIVLEQSESLRTREPPSLCFPTHDEHFMHSVLQISFEVHFAALLGTEVILILKSINLPIFLAYNIG